MICNNLNFYACAVFATLPTVALAHDRAAKAHDVESAFATRFPETRPDSIRCDGFGPLCEVVAGNTVFYIDAAARHAFIGRVYDLEAREDLTEAALNRLAGSASTSPAPDVAWDSLPFDSAILRNKGGALKVAIFSDLNCGYCRNLSAALETAPDIEAREFLIGMAGSEAASRAVGCASNPEAAIAAYYRDRAVPEADCNRDVVAPARKAARALGAAMHGTPTFVRPDGAVTSGFRDIESLRAWLSEGLRRQRGGE